MPFDLSKVMFITTANLADPITPALKDRMEIIELSGYIDEEKLKIARQYLIPRQIRENGIGNGSFDITDEAILGSSINIPVKRGCGTLSGKSPRSAGK